MKLATIAAVLAVLLAVGCTPKQQTSTSTGSETTESSTPAVTESAAASASSAPEKQDLYVTFQFNDVAVTTSGVLRLGFVVKNGGSDPLLCEESGFSLQLADGSTLEPDSGAENRCDPDTIDPGSTGKGTMFFDLKSGYAGAVTLIMSDNDTVIGRGTTQVH
jgi:archaellum component FlaG (FlaF/FlaG flagellin family)